MPFVLLYLVVEIVALVALGSAIGVGWTLLVLLAGSVLGLWLARREGVRAAQAIAAGGDQPAGGARRADRRAAGRRRRGAAVRARPGHRPGRAAARCCRRPARWSPPAGPRGRGAGAASCAPRASGPAARWSTARWSTPRAADRHGGRRPGCHRAADPAPLRQDRAQLSAASARAAVRGAGRSRAVSPGPSRPPSRAGRVRPAGAARRAGRAQDDPAAAQGDSGRRPRPARPARRVREPGRRPRPGPAGDRRRATSCLDAG